MQQQRREGCRQIDARAHLGGEVEAGGERQHGQEHQRDQVQDERIDHPRLDQEQDRGARDQRPAQVTFHHHLVQPARVLGVERQVQPEARPRGGDLFLGVDVVRLPVGGDQHLAADIVFHHVAGRQLHQPEHRQAQHQQDGYQRYQPGGQKGEQRKAASARVAALGGLRRRPVSSHGLSVTPRPPPRASSSPPRSGPRRR